MSEVQAIKLKQFSGNILAHDSSKKTFHSTMRTTNTFSSQIFEPEVGTVPGQAHTKIFQ